MRLLLLCCAFTLSLPLQARTRAPKIELSSLVQTKLESVLVRADELRQALVDKQESLATARVQNLEQALLEALRTADPDKQNKQHLDRILTEARNSLQFVNSSRGESRRTGLQNTFKAIVLIGQTYKVNDQYKFFFCSHDRSVWLQKDSKPLNPINPENFPHCGTRVE